MRGLIKEPLLHFLIIGTALFGAFFWQNRSQLQASRNCSQTSKEITVTSGDLAKLNQKFKKTWRREPTNEERKKLIQDFVRTEIYFREALANGLGRNDEVLKRRLRRRVEFLLEDVGAVGEPTDSELKKFMRKNRDDYQVGPKITFRHVYFDRSRRGTQTEAAIEEALSQLTNGAAAEAIGDPSPLPSGLDKAPLWRIKRRFGKDFAKEVKELPAGSWEGPVKSGFGLHLVFVEDRVPAHLPKLSEIRRSVSRDWAVEKQRQLKDAAYEELRSRYTVNIEERGDDEGPDGLLGKEESLP